VRGTATVRDGENVAIVDIRMPSGHDDHRLAAADVRRRHPNAVTGGSTLGAVAHSRGRIDPGLPSALNVATPDQQRRRAGGRSLPARQRRRPALSACLAITICWSASRADDRATL
jgi:hypothetical protein